MASQEEIEARQKLLAAHRLSRIESTQRTLDDERAMLWFAPRKPGTGWSRLNKERIEGLLAAGSRRSIFRPTWLWR
jgi:hypothetical protein